MDIKKIISEMTTEEKDKVSHRGNALRMLKTELKRYLEDN